MLTLDNSLISHALLVATSMILRGLKCIFSLLCYSIHSFDFECICHVEVNQYTWFGYKWFYKVRVCGGKEGFYSEPLLVPRYLHTNQQNSCLCYMTYVNAFFFILFLYNIVNHLAHVTWLPYANTPIVSHPNTSTPCTWLNSPIL